jgi:hypothetical protein
MAWMDIGPTWRRPRASAAQRPRFQSGDQTERRAFPRDFAFQLTQREFRELRGRSTTGRGKAAEPATNWSQIVTSSKASRRGVSYRPWAFAEHGAVMAANVLRSTRAVAMSVHVVRAFVRMREELMSSAVIFGRLAEIDKTLVEHDAGLRMLWGRLRPLLAPPPEPSPRQMGFHAGMKNRSE